VKCRQRLHEQRFAQSVRVLGGALRNEIDALGGDARLEHLDADDLATVDQNLGPILGVQVDHRAVDVAQQSEALGDVTAASPLSGFASRRARPVSNC
jgi:hypothetical protein